MVNDQKYTKVSTILNMHPNIQSKALVLVPYSKDVLDVGYLQLSHKIIRVLTPSMAPIWLQFFMFSEFV
jgi:hypothetical protein